ncbi:MAG TPA: lysophospholipid acyltransferase family protein [Dysgonamonadaceae bacterium]|nr:lysophospholipid acyltransferase family protein [Dysgonamonadaceae bacterium]
MNKKPLGYYLIYGLLKLHAFLPLRVLYVFSDILYVLTYHIVRYRRKMVRKNLTNSFPEKTEHEIVNIEKQFYHHFCDYFFETIKLLHISDEEMRRRMEFHGHEALGEVMKDNRSCILYLGHYGNWEWVTSIGLHLPEEMVKAQIYQLISSKSFDEIFKKIRTRFNSLNIERKETMRTIIKLRNEKQQVIYGFISDQRPPRYYDQYWTTFLNQDSLFLTGTERIARQAKYAVAYLDVQKTKRGHYKGTFSVISPDASQESELAITEMYVRKLEKTILRNPAYYLWSHNRWKFAKKKELETKSEQ